MIVAADLAVARGALRRGRARRARAADCGLGPLPSIADLRVEDALEAIRRDKKVVDGRLHFVLPVALGRAIVVDDVTEGELGEALARTGLRG